MRFLAPVPCVLLRSRQPTCCTVCGQGHLTLTNVWLASPGLESPQKDDSEKPVSDQWLDPFVIVGEDNNPVGTVQDGSTADAPNGVLADSNATAGSITVTDSFTYTGAAVHYRVIAQ